MPSKAATSSAGVIRGILRNPADLQQFKVRCSVWAHSFRWVPPPHHTTCHSVCGLQPQVAVERAVVYDKCAGLSGADKEACQLDKALVNVAAIFAQQVEGRVSTEVDPRAAFDSSATRHA